ncbi:MAG: 4-hydroxythreonine-4-phosphate dehydrogenase PdxA [Burkholderia sp.]|nr:4-hydroxythreonine-4-phosphate dehydrogenase PdxA [Burkholderia sp.]
MWLGPYTADTILQKFSLVSTDCVFVMFHDQELPILKYSTLSKGINIALGQSIYISRVDHDTALDLSGTGRRDL